MEGKHNSKAMKIPLIKPYIDDGIRKRVLDVLDSGFLTEGAVVTEFENAVAAYLNASHAIAFTSCTTGLETALRALGIGPGDEVIVPDYTYPATASVVAIVGAHCVIADIDRSTMLIDYDAIESAITPRTRAIIPVSLFGNPLDYRRLKEIKSRYSVFIVEDAACAIGAEFDGTKVGTTADITVFSLHPRKFITTGEGGIITTEDKSLAEWMSSYKHFGMDMANVSREGVKFRMAGTNFKLTNIQAAIGLGQMSVIDTLLERRRLLAGHYNDLLSWVKGVTVPAVTPGGRHSYQSYCVFVESRDQIMKTMREEGIEVQIGTYALHMHEAFRDTGRFTVHGEMAGSRYAFGHCLTLPLYHDLKTEEQELIVSRLKELI